MKPTAQEIIDIVKTEFYSQFPGGRRTPCQAGPHRAGQEAEGLGGKWDRSLRSREEGRW